MTDAQQREPPDSFSISGTAKGKKMRMLVPIGSIFFRIFSAWRM